MMLASIHTMFHMAKPVLSRSLYRQTAAMNKVARPFHTALVTCNQSLTVQSTPKIQKVEDLVRCKINYFKPEVASLDPLKEAPELFARIHIHNWNMLVTKGDLVKLPVRMKDVKVGNTLKFSECSEIGSRTHTLNGGNGGNCRLDPSIFTIRGVVLEKTRSKRIVSEKTRRRRRHVRHTVSNNCVTVMRITEISLK